MITLRKLKTLKDSTRFRKYIAILQDFEASFKAETSINKPYMKSILLEIHNEANLPARAKEIANGETNLRSINNLRHSIMTHLSIEPSEWDFTAPLDNSRLKKTKLGISLYLDDIRSPFNMGSIFRTSECFGVSNIYLSKDSTSPKHSRSIRTSMGCIDKIEWKTKELGEVKGDIFALELGGTDINEFIFPKKGTVIIGSEELGVSPEALKLADSSLGRVSIPLTGEKSSLNVANATAILLHRWNESILKG